jgi:hypothetical protein
LELAWLRNRVRLPDGRFATWRSPAGRRLGMQAAYPTFAGHDIVAALVPNGRFLDFERRTGDSRRPLGIANNGFINALLLVAQAQGFIAPRGADPTADLLAWKEVTDRGEPYGAAARGIADQLTRFHSASRLTGTPAPILMQDGWADDLFPASEALRVYNRLRQANLGARVAIQLIDSGHARGGRHPNQELAANDQAIRFFDAYLQRRTRPPPPRPGAVLAYTQHCPRDAAGGLRFTGRSWARLHPGAFRFAGPRNQMVSSAGGSSELAQAFTPNFGTSDACKTVPVERSPGTAVYQRAVRVGVTLLGRPTVTARIATSGPFGQLDSRLWDVDPAAGTQLLVTRGAYRLTAGQRGTITFQLNGNGWRFAPGHVVKLELLGRDAPYLRASNGTFDVRVASATVELPVHEPPSRAAGIARPRHAIDPAVAARR